MPRRALALRLLAFIGVAVFAGSVAPLQAANISRITPEGEVSRATQVVVRFDGPAVAAGDPRAAAPVLVQCNPAAAGSGRWNNEREYIYDFAQELGPGVRCEVSLAPDFVAASGAKPAQMAKKTFQTGGPMVISLTPGDGEQVEEEPTWVLRLNGPATADSVAQQVSCLVQGVGEKVPVRIIDGTMRQRILASGGWQAAQDRGRDAASIWVLQCARSAAPKARVQLVYGAVATPSGLVNKVERRFQFTVREPFSASFQCELENAQAGCMPLRPMELIFSAPVPRALALQWQAVPVDAQGRRGTPLKAQAAADDAQANALSRVLISGQGADGRAGVLPENTRFLLQPPADLKDDAGRSLANASSFPLAVATAAMPPLLKFSAAPFGIVERLAEAPAARVKGAAASTADVPALLPLAVRGLEPGSAAAQQAAQAPAPTVARLTLSRDADIIDWLLKVQRYHRFSVPRDQAKRDVAHALPKVVDPERKDSVQTRMLSLLQGRADVQRTALPTVAPAAPTAPNAAAPVRATDVLGLPLPAGFHVVEAASPRLGAALLDERHGPMRQMFVRTSVLVTNLAVHFKLGRADSLAWVTRLDDGQPQAGAQVQVSDCAGKVLASGTTDAQGLVRLNGLQSEPPSCEQLRKRPASASNGADEEAPDYSSGDTDGYFVSARAKNADGVDDLAFVWSSWQRGIEPWRFNLPTSSAMQADVVAHSVLSRSLLRVGETLHAKHLLRTQTAKGMGVLADRDLPNQLAITHVGSGQVIKLPVRWRRTGGGAPSADHEWQVPQTAKLGVYELTLQTDPPRDDAPSYRVGQFRVEAFVLPVLSGRISTTQKGPSVMPERGDLLVPLQMQLSYLNGGPASGLPVRLSAAVAPRYLAFDRYPEYSFRTPEPRGPDGQVADTLGGTDMRTVADREAINLDRNGSASYTVKGIGAVTQPQQLVVEASFADPNGQISTLRQVQELWPADRVVGLRTEGWVSARGQVPVQLLALDTQGRPQPGATLELRATSRRTLTQRTRLVGGFYAYDNRQEVRDLGTVCSGKSDARGLLLCQADLKVAGEVELVATVVDAQGRRAQAADSVWITGQGELWFAAENHDRMDVLAERTELKPGDTAVLQVRMPFRQATALISIEREGILHTEVQRLSGRDPTVRVKIPAGAAPNVVVSVLALRGRVRPVPWTSFFQWGWQTPLQWWDAYRFEGREHTAATALVDLAKPAFKLGAVNLAVGTQAHQLNVAVSADKADYPVRGSAQVTVQVTQPDGKPAAGAEVAVVAVDEALLELSPNPSTDVLAAMMAPRPWGVATSTAQMEVIGRRHYGRKAVPAGGGGGRSPTRELFDTLLLWQPKVVTDAQGRAQIKVPLNDALSRFRIVAVAEGGTQLFGSGHTLIRTTQDLQLISGLPPLVRAGDAYRAAFTVRNASTRAMKVQASARATLLNLPDQTLDVPAGQSREVVWQVVAPAALALTRNQEVLWEVAIKEIADSAANKGADALKAQQRIEPAVPLAVWQAGIVQIDGSTRLDVAAPDGALPGRGGVRVALQSRLTDGLPGVRDWWGAYPYSCLEQLSSRAAGTADAKAWGQLMARLPGYIDSDGLASYFPTRADQPAAGSDILTAYVLALSAEAARLPAPYGAAFALPAEQRERMLAGLQAWAEGRINRNSYTPRTGGVSDRDTRRIAAWAALARHDRVNAASAQWPTSLSVNPREWPTHTVLDWLTFVQRLPASDNRSKWLADATAELRARLNLQGTRLALARETDDAWWWHMAHADANAARVLAWSLDAAADDASLRDDLPRLALGLLGRQQRGAWATTTANAWGPLALTKFSARLESQPVAGATSATLASAAARVDWSQPPAANPAADGLAVPGQTPERSITLAWPATPGPQALALQHNGAGKPWATWQALAAVPLTQPFSAGLQMRRSLTAVEQATPGQWQRGDILRVTIEVDSPQALTWLVVNDPIPGGATVLGSGLGRDSALATAGQRSAGAAPVFEERGFDAYKAYYDYVPQGRFKLEYTVRLNTPGQFAIPPSRVEAMYAPEIFATLPNAPLVVGPR